MKKVAIFTDPHFGIYKNSNIFLESQKKFFINQFIPYLKENNIKNVWCLGDVFDNRNNINVKILNEVYSLFKNDFKDFQVKILVGNHDSYYKDIIKVNSLKYLNELPNVEIIETIQEHIIDNRKVLFVPWLTEHKQLEEYFDKNIVEAELCMGHFEISGFLYNKGFVCENGLNPEIFFKNFKLTFTGHFHRRSKIKVNDRIVQYIGNPYQLTRMDVGDLERGFCVLDLNDLSYEFINNSKSLRFLKLVYPEVVHKEMIKGNIIDVYVNISTNKDENEFEKYLEKIESYKPIMSANVKIESDSLTNVDKNYSFKSTAEMLKEYVTDLNIPEEKVVIERILQLFEEHKSEV